MFVRYLAYVSLRRGTPRGNLSGRSRAIGQKASQAFGPIIPKVTGLDHAGAVLVSITRFINTKPAPCCTGLILQKFTGAVSLVAVETSPLAPAPSPPSLEERVAAQALTIDLKEALLACLSGAESRRWTVGELLARFQGLGIPCSRLSVTGALSELELELSLCPWAPWRLLERGQEWILQPKSELAQLLCGVRALPLKDPGRLSD